MNCDRLLLCCGCIKQKKYSHYVLESRVRIPHSARVYSYIFCVLFSCVCGNIQVGLSLIRVL